VISTSWSFALEFSELEFSCLCDISLFIYYRAPFMEKLYEKNLVYKMKVTVSSWELYLVLYTISGHWNKLWSLQPARLWNKWYICFTTLKKVWILLESSPKLLYTTLCLWSILLIKVCVPIHVHTSMCVFISVAVYFITLAAITKCPFCVRQYTEWFTCIIFLKIMEWKYVCSGHEIRNKILHISILKSSEWRGSLEGPF
jgi:hypothetical protein